MPFPSPAESFIEPHLDEFIFDALVPKPSCTLIWSLKEDYERLTLLKGDLMIIEQGRNPHNGCTALVEYEGHRFVCQLHYLRGKWFISTENRKGKVTEEMTLIGVVRSSIKNQLLD